MLLKALDSCELTALISRLLAYNVRLEYLKTLLHSLELTGCKPVLTI